MPVKAKCSFINKIIRGGFIEKVPLEQGIQEKNSHTYLGEEHRK